MLVSIRKTASMTTSIVLAGVIFINTATVSAQEAPTPTPLQISLPTSTPLAQDAGGSDLNVTVPTWTSTSVAQVMLQALDIANVRALPDTAETQLGVIRNGEFYTVTGKYVSWYQLQYNASPTGFGWVYGELVQLTGDPTSIPDVDPYAQPTSAAPGSLDTGGVIATATLPSAAVSETDETGAEVFPTFTYPPGLTRPNATASAGSDTVALTPRSASTTQSDDMPPILPIIILGGLGLLGLAVTSLRR